MFPKEKETFNIYHLKNSLKNLVDLLNPILNIEHLYYIIPYNTIQLKKMAAL